MRKAMPLCLGYHGAKQGCCSACHLTPSRSPAKPNSPSTSSISPILLPLYHLIP
uniref:Uncharacterized protein n=1 Tax=Triticum urartu TaxID=4572 RepID=A0A8R7QFH0_TRIUA